MAGKILNSNVEKYLESLLPKRDPILTEMERYAKNTRRAHHRPVVRTLALSASRRTSGANGFSKWLCDRLFHNLACASRRTGRGDLLHGRPARRMRSSRDRI